MSGRAGTVARGLEVEIVARRTVRRRVYRRQAEWADIVARHEQSGLSRREFCEREGLALSSLSRWQQKLRAGEPPQFIDVTPGQAAMSSASDWDIEVELPNGIKLRLRG
jgi:hypothetical protein